MTAPVSEEAPIPVDDYLSSGSTMLNLAVTDTPWGFVAKGMYLFLVGDSDSGKTFLSLTCLAEAAQNPHFDNYRFILDNVEGGAIMNLRKFFGSKMADRLEPPKVDADGLPITSQTVEEFYYNLDDALAHEKPCIYILDSMDALSSVQETDTFGENKKRFQGGKEGKGSYGDGKAKANASGIRQALAKIRATGSILLVINQTRDKLNAMPFGPTKTKSGGHALDFYASVRLWSSIKGPIYKTIDATKHAIGNTIKVKVSRTRFTGKKTAIEIPIYPSYGIDDTCSCIDYLVNVHKWKMSGQKIDATDFGLTVNKAKLMTEIESKPGWRTKLQKLTGEEWTKVQRKASLNRNPRYE
tara:strand:+ start:3031 stop:4095 length:1065 start_codon:yes stop_codon:yes gene_type:complete